MNEGRPGTADYKSPGKEKSLRVSISHSRTKRTLHTPHHPKGFVRTDLGVQAQPAQSAQMCVKNRRRLFFRRRHSPQRGQSKKFHLSVEKSPCSRRGIAAMGITIQKRVGSRGALMGIGEYLAATALVAVILWAVLGLLMQEG